MRLDLIFWLRFGLACMVTPEALHAALTPEQIYQKVLPSVMTLEVETQSGERFIGSAVLILADDTALTAWHVVADARSVWGVFSDGQRVKMTGCIDRDGVRDLALLKLEKGMPHRQATAGHELQPVAARAYVIGTPKGYGFSISDGLISQIRSLDGFLQYQLSCPISPGNSGSPVINQEGEVIGIASWTKTDAQNVSFATPSPSFFRLNSSGQPMTWEQLAVTTRSDSTVRVVTSPTSTGKKLEARVAVGGFDAFQKWLKDSTGKNVTVVVQENGQTGQTNSFTFTVK